MGREHGVEDWLPGGMALRVPSSETNGSQDEARTIDLNEIDFEALIGRGISVGQAARFISQRERRGGISNMSEIDGFYGLSSGVRDILRQSGHVE